ncbi:ABC transporter permease [Carnobacterium divergens]|uniref:ABC transporter permease n=1 Tax=Carnobacterium divergens TaxID=2748 RepID=A0AAW8REP7_CARDV|nr:ABC transporter permease [Carnobacterium divergens]MDT1958996.1 ABC transporter permease [Carnobacterium divergens]MDT1974964.1 ABC transporter permease [Carnobacterium divergens]MDT2012928.1 ABC transporter permease [Carnobacterium divergens]
MDGILRMIRISYYSFKSMFLFLSPLAYLTVLILSPLFSLVFFTLIAKDAFGSNADLRVNIIGNAIILCYVSCFFNIGNMWIEERNFGTLKLAISSTMSIFTMIIAKGVLFIVNGLITVFFGLFVGKLLFGLNVEITLGLIAGILLGVLSVAAMGCFVGAIGLLTRDANLILNIWNMIFMALCGINFPTSRLPIFFQNISNFLPLKHSMNAITQLLQGNNDISEMLLFEAGICLMYIILTYISLKIFEKISLIYATLEFY